MGVFYVSSFIFMFAIFLLQFNYNTQFYIYEKLDAATNDRATFRTTWVRLKTLGILGLTSVITLATRIAAIAEVSMEGLLHILISPFLDNSRDNFIFGAKQIFIHAPCNILRVVALPIECLFNIGVGVFEPKYIIIAIFEEAKTNYTYAQAGKIGSDEHKSSLDLVQGIAYERMLG